MAKEITVRASLQVRKGQVGNTGNQLTFYQSNPSQFQADQNGVGGPVPGQKTAGTGGIDINFSPLTQPGVCRIQNLDAINNIHYGIWDSDHSRFHPIGMCKPGETFIFRISSKLTTEYPATGTGSPETGARFHVRAENAPCNFVLEAFQD